MIIFSLYNKIVHMRLRPINQSIPKTMSPSTSAITYWQIERQEGPVSGKYNTSDVWYVLKYIIGTNYQINIHSNLSTTT